MSLCINQSTTPPGLCFLLQQRWHPVPPPPPPLHYGAVGYVEWWDRGWRITCFRLELLLVTNGSTTMTCLERNKSVTGEGNEEISGEISEKIGGEIREKISGKTRKETRGDGEEKGNTRGDPH